LEIFTGIWIAPLSKIDEFLADNSFLDEKRVKTDE